MNPIPRPEQSADCNFTARRELPFRSLLRNAGLARTVAAVLVAALAMGAAASCAPPPPPTHQIDVSNPSGCCGGLVVSSQWDWGQTFIATKTGLLDQITLWTQNIGRGPMRVTIHAVDTTGHAAAATIGTVSYSGTTIGKVQIAMTTPAPVVYGHRYVMVLQADYPASDPTWQLAFNDPPLAGQLFYTKYNGPDDYSIYEHTGSLAFETWVLPGFYVPWGH